MSRHKPSTKHSPFPKDTKSLLLAVLTAAFLVCVIWSVTKPWTTTAADYSDGCLNNPSKPFNRTYDPPEKTFYDDPKLSYALGGPRVENWDEKRKQWLKLHPSFAAGAHNRILILSGSQPAPCSNPIGDHLLMRCYKNKVDYSRIHGYDIFYNTACFDPKMCNVWAKLPLIRAALLTHPETEWIWWLDSDAIFTDMYFKIPLHKYDGNGINMVVPGWPDLLYEKKSWLSINAGSFLMRNTQWSLDLLEVWASMGPRGPDYDFWSKTMMATLSDKTFPTADEQSCLVYLILYGDKKWRESVHIETEYDLSSYWLAIVGKLDNYTRQYGEVQRKTAVLRRRRAEVVARSFGDVLEEVLGDNKYNKWPFILHFTGCQPCNGKHDPKYDASSCWVGFERALNFADNQVLENYGFAHKDLSDGSSVLSPLEFAFPFPLNDDSGNFV